MKKFLAGMFLFILGAMNWQGRPMQKKYPESSPVIHSHDTVQEYTLYLTIDDGPLEGTPYIDSVFRKEKVPADLFLVGSHVYQDKIFTRYFRELKKNKWFEFDNHSYTHANEDYEYYYGHPKTVLHDMRRNDDSLHFSNTICRMPARNMWRLSGKRSNDGISGIRAANLLQRKGYSVIGWDLEWEYDSLNRPAETADSLFQLLEVAFKKDLSFVPGHVILLCHDWMFTNPVAKNELDQFIQLVKAAGNIRFEWLTKYPLYKGRNDTIRHPLDQFVINKRKYENRGIHL